jgi:hypothetical protein
MITGSPTLKKITDSMRGGGWDKERIPAVFNFVTERGQHYADKLGVSFEDVVAAWEENRDYAAVNYYQNANFPKIDGDTLLVNDADELKKICDGKGFVCGACLKHISSPYECEKCGWKTYGLLGPGKDALYVVLKPAMRGEWIFRPVVLPKGAK